MSKRVAGKVAIVTGAASGMGRAGATLLAAEGGKVVVADINEVGGTRVTQAIRDAGGEAMFVSLDVRSLESVKALVQTTLSHYGRIDVLYHNAVDVRFVNEEDRRLTELPEETWDRMIDLILSGTFRCCKYVGRQMIAQHSGSIILSATDDALIGCAGLDAYTAAKGGVISLTRSFAAGMGKEGVRVNAICPGFFPAEQNRKLLDQERMDNIMHHTPMRRFGEPEELVGALLLLVSPKAGSFLTGAHVNVDGGFTALWF